MRGIADQEAATLAKAVGDMSCNLQARAPPPCSRCPDGRAVRRPSGRSVRRRRSGPGYECSWIAPRIDRQGPCGRSNIYVDRLEKAGLAERAASPDDRRVKLVRATGKGAQTTKRLMASYHRPPPEVAHLTQRELDELIRIFRKLHETAQTSP